MQCSKVKQKAIIHQAEGNLRLHRRCRYAGRLSVCVCVCVCVFGYMKSGLQVLWPVVDFRQKANNFYCIIFLLLLLVTFWESIYKFTLDGGKKYIRLLNIDLFID